MVIAVYGAGYVGLITALCFAKLGYQVICADRNGDRVALLAEGETPIYEEGLSTLLQEQLQARRITFTNNLLVATKSASIHIIATGTPELPDGSADLSSVFMVAGFVAEHSQNNGLLVTKSTVPVGTGDELEALVKSTLEKNPHKITLDVASNPEFLREGSAISDFLNADRIIAGGNDKAVGILADLYQPLIKNSIPFVAMSRRSAELTKYSANAMLASKISFINQISQLAEKFGANIDDIRQGMALDPRIGPHFLQAGIGYGGSCFPKDVCALIQTAKSVQVDTNFLEAIDNINEFQKTWISRQLAQYFNKKLQGVKIGFWGLAFKPGTDDLREASSIVAIRSLLEAGADVIAYDPAAVPAAQLLFGNARTIKWCNKAEEVLDSSLDALVIATEWPEFKTFPLHQLQQKLQKAPIFDGRNCFDLQAVKDAQLLYYSVGRPIIANILLNR